MTQKNRTRLVHGEISCLHNGTSAPFTIAMLSNKFQKYQGELYTDGVQTDAGGWRYEWDEMLKYLTFEVVGFDFNRQNETYRRDGIKPENVNSLLGEIQRAGDQSGTSFTKDVKLVIYSEIDNRIPLVSKILGYNAFYQSLIGGNNTTRSYTISDNGGISWDDAHIKTFVVTAWLDVWGVNIDVSGANGYDADPSRWIDTIWIQTNRLKNLYQLPSSAWNMNSGAHGLKRRTRSNLDGSNAPATSQGTYNFNTNRVIYSFDAKIGNYGSFSSNDIEAKATMTNAPMTSVFLRGVSDVSGRAIYLKPFGGIDTVCFPKFDDGQYRLESEIFQDTKRKRYKIMDVPKVNGSSNGHEFYTDRIRRDQLWIGGRKDVMIPARYKEEESGWDMRFYIRDLYSGKVSPLSDIGIKANVGKRRGYSALDYRIHYF